MTYVNRIGTSSDRIIISITCRHVDKLCQGSCVLLVFLLLFILKINILDQGYTKIRLIRSLKKFIFRYQDLFEIYSVSAETMINDAFSYSENV